MGWIVPAEALFGVALNSQTQAPVLKITPSPQCVVAPLVALDMSTGPAFRRNTHLVVPPQKCIFGCTFKTALQRGKTPAIKEDTFKTHGEKKPPQL